jgi:hypothetical protein
MYPTCKWMKEKEEEEEEEEEDSIGGLCTLE